MLLHEFPEINWLRSQAKSRFENKTGWKGQKLEDVGWPTVILNTKAANTLREEIPGPFSIFTNLSGDSTVRIASKEVIVNENIFFVSNPGQVYTLDIKSQAEIFNLHIGEKMAEAILYAATNSTSQLLNNPNDICSQIELPNKMYWRDSHFNQSIQQLASVESPLKEQEILSELILRLLDEHYKIKKDQNLKLIKLGTQQEIERRLFLATDYIYSHFTQTITLEQLAQVSCLSKFHFLRLFKEYFHETPHQFITRIRLEKSIDYLRKSESSIKEITQKVGIENASSFSRLFHNHFGIYPSYYRISA
jgi:AraC family transcriptional regulator